jgi:transcriptional regulator with XRE-family HTH domain
MAKDLQELGSLIRDRRVELGLSQTELAGKAKLLQRDISRVENGLNCGAKTLFKILKALSGDLQVKWK